MAAKWQDVTVLTYRAPDVGCMSRDRPERTGVEITPEMIEAGVSVLSDYDEWIRLGPTGEKCLVREILEAALKVSSGDAKIPGVGYGMTGEVAMAAKWQDLTISAGQMESEVIPISVHELACPPGQVRRADGTKFKGNERPRFTVVEPAVGQSKIVLNEAAPTDLVFKVKRESETETDA